MIARRYEQSLEKFNGMLLAEFLSDAEFHYRHFKSQHFHLYNQIIHLVTFPLMHYFAWAALLPAIPPYVSYYILSMHFFQAFAYSVTFAVGYSTFYIMLWVAARYDPLFHGYAAYCLTSWLLVGTVQFVVGHRVIQGEFPRNKAPLSPLFRRIGVVYETLFGMAMLFRLMTDVLQLKVDGGSHGHTHNGKVCHGHNSPERQPHHEHEHAHSHDRSQDHNHSHSHDHGHTHSKTEQGKPKENKKVAEANKKYKGLVVV